MKRFVIKTMLYMIPLMVAVGYYLVRVQPRPKGDLARISAINARYQVPALEEDVPVAPCRDVDFDTFTWRGEGELVVFGDSFSARNDRIWSQGRWHQFLGGLTGKQIVSIASTEDPVARFVSILVNRPELLGDTVVVESVERQVAYRLCYLDFDNVISQNREKHSNRGGESSIEEKYATVTNTMRDACAYYQHLVGYNMAVHDVSLDGEFFSWNPAKMYYYDEDTSLKPTPWELSTAADNLQRLDSLCNAKGIKLIFVVIPDKYTVYHHYIVGGDDCKRILERPCAFEGVDCFVNLLPVMSSEVEKGVKDVYLPDDTHFSVVTAVKVGERVAGVFNRQ